jgi:hypothetical protein
MCRIHARRTHMKYVFPLIHTIYISRNHPLSPNITYNSAVHLSIPPYFLQGYILVRLRLVRMRVERYSISLLLKRSIYSRSTGPTKNYIKYII